MHHYYLYQHRRNDTNQIFYIGIGQKQLKKARGFKTEFERAHAKSKRTQYWKNIVAKTDYTIEILLESDDPILIQEKEIELIKLYGRKCCDPSGILVNFQKGGEKTTGSRQNRNIKINQLSISNELIKCWEQLADIERETGWLKTNIVKCCRKKQLTAYGFKWEYTNDRSYDNLYATTARKKTVNNRVGITVTNIKSGKIESFRTISDACIYFGYHYSTIQKYLSGKSKNKFFVFTWNSWK